LAYRYPQWHKTKVKVRCNSTTEGYAAHINVLIFLNKGTDFLRHWLIVTRNGTKLKSKFDATQPPRAMLLILMFNPLKQMLANVN